MNTNTVAYLYLLAEVPFASEAVADRWTKIGVSANPPEWRINRNVRPGNPRDLHLPVVYEFPTEADAYAAEAAAHREFSRFRGRGEWFRSAWQAIAAWCDSQAWCRRPDIREPPPGPETAKISMRC